MATYYGEGPGPFRSENRVTISLRDARADTERQRNGPAAETLAVDGRTAVGITLNRGPEIGVTSAKPQSTAAEVMDAAHFEHCNENPHRADYAVFTQAEENRGTLTKAVADFGPRVVGLDCRLEIKGPHLILNKNLNNHTLSHRQSFSELVREIEAWGNETRVGYNKPRIDAVTYWRQKRATPQAAPASQKDPGLPSAAERLAEKIPGLTACAETDIEATHLVIDLTDSKIKAGALAGQLGKLPEGIRLVTDGKNKVAALSGPEGWLQWPIYDHPLFREKGVRLSVAKATAAQANKPDEKTDPLKAWLDRSAVEEAAQAAAREAKKQAEQLEREKAFAKRMESEMAQQRAMEERERKVLAMDRQAGADCERQVARSPEVLSPGMTAESVSAVMLRKFPPAEAAHADVLKAETLENLWEIASYKDTLIALIDCGNFRTAQKCVDDQYRDRSTVDDFYRDGHGILIRNYGRFVVFSAHGKNPDDRLLAEDIHNAVDHVGYALIRLGNGYSPFNTLVTRVKRQPKPAESADAVIDRLMKMHFPDLPVTRGNGSRKQVDFGTAESRGRIDYEDILMVLIDCQSPQAVQGYLRGEGYPVDRPYADNGVYKEAQGQFIVLRIQDPERPVSQRAIGTEVAYWAGKAVQDGKSAWDIGLTLVKKPKPASAEPSPESIPVDGLLRSSHFVALSAKDYDIKEGNLFTYLPEDIQQSDAVIVDCLSEVNAEFCMNQYVSGAEQNDWTMERNGRFLLIIRNEKVPDSLFSQILRLSPAYYLTAEKKRGGLGIDSRSVQIAIAIRKEKPKPGSTFDSDELGIRPPKKLW